MGDFKIFGDLIETIQKLPSLRFGFLDFVDILLVTFVIFELLKLIRETRAFQLLKGLTFLGIAYFIVQGLNMQGSSYLLRFIFSNIIIILVVVFSDEIKNIIEHIGVGRFSSLLSFLRFNKNRITEDVNEAIIEICKAVERMSDSKTGALIVMERHVMLSDVAKNGIPVDAKITHELIGNVFYPKSPLHDGAALVRNGRLVSAGCVLPNTYSSNVSSDLGTRHRAAIGMSEKSDAVIVVVSEETGIISIAVNGKIYRNYTESELRDKLIEYLSDEDEVNKSGISKYTQKFRRR